MNFWENPPTHHPMTHQPTKNNRAFTLVELLVAGAIGAAVIATAVIGFAMLSGLPGRGSLTDLTLPSGVISNFYGEDLAVISLGPNPNYFQAAQARRMKERLISDVLASSAVFCLGRNLSGRPSLRPSEIPVANVDFRDVATPQAFRNFLNDSQVSFPEQPQGALLATTNASIFLVGTLASVAQETNSLAVVATYEVDFVATVDPPGGTLASVRRYAGTNRSVPTDYYHAYYPQELNGADGFRPLGAFFGRQPADPTGAAPFSIAVNQPFSFVWWPDPLVSRLGGAAVPSPSSDSARANYDNMAGRTSLFFVLPTFPSL